MLLYNYYQLIYIINILLLLFVLSFVFVLPKDIDLLLIKVVDLEKVSLFRLF